MSGYRKALRYSEEACQLEPENGDFLSTLGVAYYRVGNYEKALDVLLRSDKINALKDKGSRPADLAFLAMTHQQLGHTKEAEAKLQLLRERMKDPRWRKTPRLRASCAKRKNCWQNPSRRAASKHRWRSGAMSDESIFAAALSKAPGAERRAFLDGACGSDDDLRRRIERLLEADDQTAGILERGPDAGPTDAPGEDGPPLLPERVFAGRFKLRQKLGEGGMGEVWVADQAAPVQRRVAVKVVRPGLDSERMLARFDQERQALALMDHPNIAKVLDAGEADGRPYFVMELIKGVPITDYCDRARLSPRERLALFVPVCEAVQHAHQKGVVHRDLKPSNILVALYDGRPVPKVIDFGIAKATGPRLTDRSIYTEVGALIGTLEYMAPEQAELNNLDIDTRADVYALGAILYELLTGSVPFSRQELQAAGFLEMLRVIREVEPPRPSTKLSKSGTLPSVADVRRTDPQKLVSLMRGELDWIILKCLEKDRGRRYQAASGLARDLEHYLADEPVEACPPTAGYRLRKFARKYRTPMLVAGAFVLLLALGAIVAAWQAVRATAAERSASVERGRRPEP